MKNFLNKQNHKYFKNGFTAVEIMVAMGITVGIFFAVFNFGQGIFSFNSGAQRSLNAQTDARKVLKSFARELRSASPSSLGAYPVAQAGTSTLTFFSNIDGGSDKEQIRYFLQGTELKKGVTKPSGSPLTYNSANEKIQTLVRDVRNGASTIFSYFDSNYMGTSSPLVQPVQVTAVRLIHMKLMINKDPNKNPVPFYAESQVFLRNLKDNL